MGAALSVSLAHLAPNLETPVLLILFCPLASSEISLYAEPSFTHAENAFEPNTVEPTWSKSSVIRSVLVAGLEETISMSVVSAFLVSALASIKEIVAALIVAASVNDEVSNKKKPLVTHQELTAALYALTIWLLALVVATSLAADASLAAVQVVCPLLQKTIPSTEVVSGSGSG